MLGCNRPVKLKPMDEYVLIEFAARLEEDYEKNGGDVLNKK
jgi:hypothetical protein